MIGVRHDLILSPQSLRPGIPFAERLEAAARGGFRALSLRVQDHAAALAQGLSAIEQRALLRDLGLQVAEVGFASEWISQAPAAAANATLWQMCELFEPSYINAGLWVAADLDETASAFGRFCDEARRWGVSVALEFVPYSGIRTLQDAWTIVERSTRDNAGLVLDVWHAHRSGVAPSAVASIPAHRWLSVQICDAEPIAWDDIMEESRHARLLPGEGCIDIAGYLRALAAIGARPAVAVEVISDKLHAMGSAECCALLADTSARALEAAGFNTRLNVTHRKMNGNPA